MLNCDQKWRNKHRYPLFITSLTDIKRFSYAVCKHWSIENQLHWSLDIVIFRGGLLQSQKKYDMSPRNLNVLRKTALALGKHADFGHRASIRKKRFAATLNPDRFLDILFAKL